MAKTQAQLDAEKKAEDQKITDAIALEEKELADKKEAEEKELADKKEAEEKDLKKNENVTYILKVTHLAWGNNQKNHFYATKKPVISGKTMGKYGSILKVWLENKWIEKGKYKK